MKRNPFYIRRMRWGPVLLGAAALTLVACDSEVNFNPAAPTFPNATNNLSMRNLEIAGSLTSEEESALEATILYDGKELEGARTSCPELRGCARLELSGDVRTTSGRHTISFQLLNQASESVEYVARGTVRVTREGLGFELTLPLGPTRAALRSGESVTFDVELRDSLFFE